MLIAAPVQSASDVAPLVRAGASEVYCGCLPPEWAENYGPHDSANRRQGLANAQTLDELRAIAREAARMRVPAFLALNARYTRPQYPLLLAQARAFAGAGGAAVHVSDIGFLEALVAEALPLQVSISLLAVALNAQAVRVYRGLGASRVVLPRCLSISEMGKIAAACPDMAFEAMVALDRCSFVDGLCRCHHGVGYQGAEGAPKRAIRSFDTGTAGFGCHALAEEGAPIGACAACRMKEMEAAGVRVGKLGGRGLPLGARLKWVRFLRDVGKARDQDEIVALRSERFGGVCGCYYEG